VVTMLDLEAGAGWTSPGGRVPRHRRIHAQRLAQHESRTPTGSRPSRPTTFRSLEQFHGHVLNFDGFVVRTELRF